MKTRNLFLSGTLLFGLFLFNACGDDSNSVSPLSQDVNTDITEQDAELEDLVEAVSEELDAYLSEGTDISTSAQLKSNNENIPSCLTVESPDDAVYPIVITFDFGTENYEDRHGREKRGQIIVTKTGPYWEEGSERTVEFVDFYINDNAIVGSEKYKNEGLNDDGNLEFSINIDVTLETTENVSWTRKANKIRTMIVGADTENNAWDDEFLISGTSSGTSSLGCSVEREITTPIYRKRTCRFPLSGIVEIVKTLDGVTTTTWLNYGDGECDYTATVTEEDGNTKEITLENRFRKRNHSLQ